MAQSTASLHPVLRLSGVTRKFGTLRALDDVSVDFRAGEVHAVLGENGAGKSTLMNVIYGLVRPDAGRVELDGQAVRFASPNDARRAGIGMVHQEFALVDALSVAENLATTLSPPGARRYDRTAVVEAARRLATEVGLDMGDPDRPVGELPVGARQRIEILKALAGRTRVLILDEPTAVLTPGETGHLFRVLERLRSQGVAVLFITHKLHEVMEIADHVTVLRRGRVVVTLPRAAVTERRLAEMMVGELPERPAADPARGRRTGGGGLVLRGLSVRPRPDGHALDDIEVSVAGGEIFGMAGVDGNGQAEIFSVLAGLRVPDAGAVRVDGVSPARFDTVAMQAAGIGWIPPDRQRQGLVMQASVADNAVLHRAVLDDVARGPFLSPARTRAAAQDMIAGYAIRADDPGAAVSSLSGGNQQRLVVARTLHVRPRVLVAFNPTRGLDIAAACAVQAVIRAAAAQGSAVLLLSTDLDEVIELSDRIGVLYRGRLSEPLEPPFSAERLGAMMAGLSREEVP